MDTKLTLKLNDAVIKRAKAYAASHNISLSRLVETYLKAITQSEGKSVEISPFVKSMATGIQIPADLDANEAFQDGRESKHQ